MVRQLLGWAGCGAALGALLGLAVGKGDPLAPLFVAGVGLGLGLLGALTTAGAHRCGARRMGGAGLPVIVGLLVGAALGATTGVVMGLGAVVIRVLNPDLAPQDFQAFCGGLAGGLGGAVGGTLLGGVVQRMWSRGQQTQDRNRV